MSTELKPLNTPTEASAYLGISKAHLARLRVEGTGPRFVKFGTDSRAAVRYRREDLIDFIESRVCLNTTQGLAVTQ